MSDRLDKELSGHIRAVFDAYEEPYDAARWQQLQRKRRGKIATLYLKRTGAAAAVAVLLAAGVLLLNRQPLENEPFLTGASQQNETNTAVSPAETTVSSGSKEITGETVSAAGPGTAEETASSGDVPAETGIARPAAASAGRTTAISASNETSSPEMQAEGKETPFPGAVAPGEGRTAREGLSPETEGTLAGIPDPPENGVGTNAQEVPGGRQEQQVAAGRQNAPGTGGIPGTSEGQALAGNQEDRNENRGFGNTFPAGTPGGENPAGNPLAESKERSGRFSVGFVTTSLMNYADGNTASEVHFGAGITSGWKVNDRLSVHSGVILAENSLSLDRSNSSVRAMASFAADRAQTTELSAVGKNNIVQNISPNSMDVNLLVMDIPLNLTYRVDVGRSNLLLTGGLSSFAYLDQEYSYHNTMQLYTNASVEAPEPVVRDEKAFSHFDFAKQLNLAVGTELPLGKGSVLILEPYVKYPLGELTSEQIRFGSAGMNLRLSFGSK